MDTDSVALDGTAKSIEERESRRKTPLSRFWIPLWLGIFDHRDEIGPAIWTFAWLVNAVTRESADGIGLCKGGRPITAKEIASETCSTERAVRSDLKRLKGKGHIYVLRTPCGFRIEVPKSKRWKKGLTQDGKSLPKETDAEASRDSHGSASLTDTKTSGDLPKSVSPIKNRQEDTKLTNPTTTPQCVGVGGEKIPADGEKQSSPVDSKSAFAQAATIYRKTAGRPFRNLSTAKQSIWDSLIRENGVALVLDAVKGWVEDLTEYDVATQKHPACLFLSQADQEIEAARQRSKDRAEEERKAKELAARRDKMYTEAVEKHGADRVARLDDLPKDAPISSVTESRLMFSYGNHWGPLEYADSFLKRQAELDRDHAARQAREREELIEIQVRDRMDAKYGMAGWPKDCGTEMQEIEAQVRAELSAKEEVDAVSGN